jgi:hypothetical protein
MTSTQFDRFMAKIDYTSSSCWSWTAAKCPSGYGRFGVDGRTRLPHRLAYEYFIGQIVNGTEIDHLCRNRACVNPTHLEAVPHRENCNRGTAGQRTRERNIASVGTTRPPRTALHCEHLSSAKRAYWQRKREAA